MLVVVLPATISISVKKLCEHQYQNMFFTCLEDVLFFYMLKRVDVEILV